MSSRRVYLVLVLLVGVALTGCGLPGGSSKPKIATLPDLTGKGLQYAQDTAQAAGFRSLASHDSSGQNRHSVLDRNWKVCFQQPGPGDLPTNTKVDFGVVKLEEECPLVDKYVANGNAGAVTMPDVTGMSALAATTALGNNASISFADKTGANRSVILQSNWKVCSQSPAAGSSYGGVPVTLTVVKNDESC